MYSCYHVDFQPYQLPLPFPLVTAHGPWTIREGIVIRLTNAHGQTTEGEIAPLPWFGTETLAMAQDFCQQLNGQITPAEIEQIPHTLPCCQFAFGSAVWHDCPENDDGRSLLPCQLLPTGAAVFPYLASTPLPTHPTLKWKIGVHSFEIESVWFLRLIKQLPPGTRLRLDANGGLSLEDAQQWLSLLDRQRQNTSAPCIEYLEQPLPPERIKEMFGLARTFQTAIALDESVAQLAQLRTLYQQEWPGLYILKAAIMGDPRRLDSWLNAHPCPVIFSSVFETAIARHTVLKLAQRWNAAEYAVGFSPLQLSQSE